MINEMKNSIIEEMEKLVKRMANGYQPNLSTIIDKIYYCNYLDNVYA